MAIIDGAGTFGIEGTFGTVPLWSKGEVAMLTLIAGLMFAGALGAAGFAIYATVAPSLSKIQAALAGHGGVSTLPPLPPRRMATVRVTVRPVATQSYWRAAA